MSVVGASFIVVGFAVLAHFIGLSRWTGQVMKRVKDSMAVLRNSQLDDHAKEKALQHSTVRLFKLLSLLLVGSAVAVLAPVAVVWLFDAIGLISFDAVLDMLQRLDFLLAAMLISFAAFFALRRFNP